MLVLSVSVFWLFWAIRSGKSRLGHALCSVFFDLPDLEGDSESLAEKVRTS